MIYPLDSTIRRLRAVSQDGHASEEIERSERKPWGSWGGDGFPVSLSANSLSLVLPSLDSTDWRGTARSLHYPTFKEPEPGSLLKEAINSKLEQKSCSWCFLQVSEKQYIFLLILVVNSIQLYELCSIKMKVGFLYVSGDKVAHIKTVISVRFL